MPPPPPRTESHKYLRYCTLRPSPPFHDRFRPPAVRAGSGRFFRRGRAQATFSRSGDIFARSLEIALERICETRDSVSSRMAAISWSLSSSK